MKWLLICLASVGLAGWMLASNGGAYEANAMLPVEGGLYSPVATPTPTPVPTPSISDEICTVFGNSPYGCQFWIDLATCESTLRPDVDTNWPYVGLLQVDVVLHAGLIARLGYTLGDMYRASPNLSVGWVLSHSGSNLNPWPWCRWQ